MGDFKSFTARTIIDFSVDHRAETLLKQLKFGKACHKRDREFQLWQEGSHPQQIQNADMIRQKLDYIHENPVERGYVARPEHWRYSSAANYAGEAGIFPVNKDWF